MAQQQKNKTKKKLALNIVNGVYGCHIENLGSRKGGGGGGGGGGGLVWGGRAVTSRIIIFRVCSWV